MAWSESFELVDELVQPGPGLLEPLLILLDLFGREHLAYPPDRERVEIAGPLSRHTREVFDLLGQDIRRLGKPMERNLEELDQAVKVDGMVALDRFLDRLAKRITGLAIGTRRARQLLEPYPLGPRWSPPRSSSSRSATPDGPLLLEGQGRHADR